MVVCVISASSSFSLLSHDSPVFVIYSIGLFASLSLSFFCVSLLCSGGRDRFTWAGFFEAKMPTAPRCSQSSSNQGLIPVIKI